jgi:hypothetical protein
LMMAFRNRDNPSFVYVAAGPATWRLVRCIPRPAEPGWASNHTSIVFGN